MERHDRPRRRSRSPRHRHSQRERHRSRDRSTSRSPLRSRYRSRSPRTNKDGARPRSPAHRRSKLPLPSQDEIYRDQEEGASGAVTKAPPVEKANFKASGLLAAEANKVTIGNGDKSQDIVLKYHEPSEARKPPSSEAWVVYVFKGQDKDPIQTIQIHTRSCWLAGREIHVADIPTEHPSCSKQHAVFQFRYIMKKDQWGEKKGKVRLYLLDLESSNGTFLNDERIEGAQYVECRSGDVVKFGESTREYVLLLPPKG